MTKTTETDLIGKRVKIGDDKSECSESTVYIVRCAVNCDYDGWSGPQRYNVTPEAENHPDAGFTVTSDEMHVCKRQ